MTSFDIKGPEKGWYAVKPTNQTTNQLFVNILF